MVKKLSKQLLDSTQDIIFRTIHNRCLIYNACWEDPRIDRELLGIDGASKLVVITSAGCNTLDYALDGPQIIHAVDVNPRQNAVLHLKLALIERADHNDLFAMFGRGAHPAYRELYAALREGLPGCARAFWDKNIDYFDPGSGRKSFYYHGTSGAVAWLLTRYLQRPKKKIKTLLLDLINADSLAEQQTLYAKIEPELWSRFSAWLVKHPAALALLGVPRPQIKLINARYPGGVSEFVNAKFKHVLTQVPIKDNYFWRVYLTGSYTATCCPNYLLGDNLARLRAVGNRIHTHTNTLSGFLLAFPDDYSHFLLLDHQDWLAWHNPKALLEEWELIIANSRPGSKILMRSAGYDLDFLPLSVAERLRFYPELTAALHLRDRVGTYGSLHLAEVL